LSELFPGRFYIELMRHGMPEEEITERGFLELAYSENLPLIATNNCFFADESMFEAHDSLLCIAQGVHVDFKERRRLTASHRFRSPEEMEELFQDIPEAINNTLVVARRCGFMPEERNPILPKFPISDGMGETEYLRIAALDGLKRRLEADTAKRGELEGYYKRLDFELSVIKSMGFSGYFLIVADFIQWAKSREIPVGPGRGSGAGSVVAWALTITDLDPLRFGLLFERFLNPERVSMPDFDIDFCQDRRDEVIRYVQEKYGTDKVAQIITFGKLQARAVLRDVGRVLGIPYGYVDKICKLVPFNPAKPPTLAEAIESEPELKRLRDTDDQIQRLLDIGLKLEGLFRHASTHAAGVVIGDRPLEQLVPLYRDPRSEMPATQFSMKYAEAAGLVKFDFLGLKTLTVINRAVALIRKTGSDLNISSLPLDDRKTFDLLASGNTVGVFQLESAGMRDVLRQLKPDKFEDIIALVALYRPGPMDNIPKYIACKHGKEKPDYLHEDLKDVLKETFGVMIYQEQVMQIAQILAGYSLGGADLLRRAMGKKIKSEMEAQRNTFVDGAVSRGIDKAQAESIFEQVDKFAGYGFNKSHAAAYALIAYQTAWLKANHPVEFFAASMTLDLGNTDKINVFRQELERLDIKLLQPDVNYSLDVFGVEYGDNGLGSVRYALAAVKNVGLQAMGELLSERETHGFFRSALDMAKRLGSRVANKRMLENLIRAGALDGLEPNRRKLFDDVDRLVRAAASAENERRSGQVSLFGTDMHPEIIEKEGSNVSDWPLMERLDQEFDAIGFYLSSHPLDSYGMALERIGVIPTENLSTNSIGTRPKLAGVVIRKQERTSSRGNRFAFLQISGSSGVFEVVLFSELLSQSRDLLEPGKVILLTCEVRGDDREGLRLTAVAIEDLDAAIARSGSGLKIHVAEREAFVRIHETIKRAKSGRSQVSLVMNVDQDQVVEVSLPGTFALSADIRAS
ncbi:MAG: DNA polymerase III subunit alpha, partial [Rhodospirillaceae bacterium]